MTTLDKNNIYDAKEVANYFICLASQKVFGEKKEREGVTNLKLQKILYFAMTANPTDYNKKWTIIINFVTN